ncbi:MAG: ABC transporter ATP-binding protein [Desulfobacterales bacterium]|nr:ABC transporter ATP-binding protein [Desulfobacterales bacterium]
MLKVEGLTKRFVSESGVVHAAQDIGFEVPEGKMFTLLGPSGCGKTTTLRCIAGLETADEGRIELYGKTLTDSGRSIFIPPNKRKIGMVFQSYAIWPHMNVFKNVAYPLKYGPQKLSKGEIGQRVAKILSLVKLEGLATRDATKLSGGQQQRLALARALVQEPRLLLFDEPLSNLDAKLREHMRQELMQLQRAVGLTAVYVTHDQAEALALSDFIAVLNEGRIIQIGTPKEIYFRPSTKFVAEFIGTSNFIPGEKVEPAENKAGFSVVQTPLGPLTGKSYETQLESGQKFVLSVRPEDIQVWTRPPADMSGKLEATIERVTFQGGMSECWLKIGQLSLKCNLHPSEETSPGQKVYIQFIPERVNIIRLAG